MACYITFGETIGFEIRDNYLFSSALGADN